MAALSATEIIMRYVCPAAGSVIAFGMFAAPMPAVREVRRRRYLGDVNSLPFAAMAANCLSWIFYGFLNRDWFVYCPNFVGLMFGWYYLFSCFKFSTDKAQEALMWITMGTAALFFAVGLVHLAAQLPLAAARTMWGSAAVGVLAIYYTAPLSTMAAVLRQRDSSSLNAPLSVMNVVNGCLWFAYGLAIRDYFIMLPNGVGAALNVVCVLLCLVFPKKRTAVEAVHDLPHDAAAGPPVRLQSAHFDPVPDDGALPHRAPPSSVSPGARSFFDITRLAWRSGGGAAANGGGGGGGSPRRAAALGGGGGDAAAAKKAGDDGTAIKLVVSGGGVGVGDLEAASDETASASGSDLRISAAGGGGGDDGASDGSGAKH